MTELVPHDEWAAQLRLNPKGFTFELLCSDCKSKNTQIINRNDTAMGSEYTGMYGDATVVFKCIDCGNAYTIVVVDY